MGWQIVSFVLDLFKSKTIYVTFVTGITILVGILLNRFLRRTYERSVDTYHVKTSLFGDAMPVMDRTKFNMIRRMLVSIIYIIGLLLIISAIPELKKFSYSLFAGAGVLAIIIGFATQKVFSNIMAGVFISMFEPFRLGDRIMVSGQLGLVDDITLWHTVIKTLDNQRLIIPNSIMAEERVTNYSITDERILNNIDFGISYDSDIDLAKKIIGEEVQKSKYYIDNAEEHSLLAGEDPYKIRVIEHADSAIVLRLYVWTKNATEGFLMKCDLLESVKKRFDKEGVEIPFPYRTIVEKRRTPRPKRLKAGRAGRSKA